MGKFKNMLILTVLQHKVYRIIDSHFIIKLKIVVKAVNNRQVDYNYKLNQAHNVHQQQVFIIIGHLCTKGYKKKKLMQISKI